MIEDMNEAIRTCYNPGCGQLITFFSIWRAPNRVGTRWLGLIWRRAVAARYAFIYMRYVHQVVSQLSRHKIHHVARCNTAKKTSDCSIRIDVAEFWPVFGETEEMQFGSVDTMVPSSKKYIGDMESFVVKVGRI